MELTRVALARQIRKLRGARSQEEFAKATGLNRSFLSRLEKEEGEPMNLRTLMQIAIRFEMVVSVNFITPAQLAAKVARMPGVARVPGGWPTRTRKTTPPTP